MDTIARCRKSLTPLSKRTSRASRSAATRADTWSFFRYLHDLLKERQCGHIKIFGGGGGTIIPEEKRELQAYGICRIYHPEDGRRLGLQGMINEMVALCDHCPTQDLDLETLAELGVGDWKALAQAISLAELAICGTRRETPRKPRSLDQDNQAAPRWEELEKRLTQRATERRVPILGLTGTGGAGKSSLTDELLRRYCEDFPDQHLAVLSVDPSKRRGGGALLGDRIRMNTLGSGRIYMRSLATRGAAGEISRALSEAITICRAAGFDAVLVETSGIGQADAAIADHADLSIYVMTPEFGAQSQLEKISMLDVADIVVVNKFDKVGGQDALHDVRKAFQRAQQRFDEQPEAMPVYAAVASQFNDRGTNQIYAAVIDRLTAQQKEPSSDAAGIRRPTAVFAGARRCGLPEQSPIIPARRAHYLAEIAESVRAYKKRAAAQAELAETLWALARSIGDLWGRREPAAECVPIEAESSARDQPLVERYNALLTNLDSETLQAIVSWPETVKRYRSQQNTYQVRKRSITVDNFARTLSDQAIPRVAVPRLRDWGSIARWRLLENLPGYFPFTAGVFPFKRKDEDPTRMFAGEGGPAQTNTRFHYLSRHSTAKRLSTAFDSVTLYGRNPDRRPDIWGKVGNSGVSIAHVEDMEQLFAGFDLLSPQTSVSMTINGPAPTILAFFFNAAVRQQLRRQLKQEGKIEIDDADCLQPRGGGFTFEELRQQIDDQAYRSLVGETVKRLRGTVQADILKEDQAQNTCIFSTDFSLKLMGDVQQWFCDNDVRNFYSVSISGYHIAEAGANPITQLAFTLANGFTYVEYYRARGMSIDDFAPNLSFFFSNGMDPEYSVIGRVARRIWAVAMRDVYGGSEKSQKLKYHIQTSGRSLHAQEIDFNDIRTTLQALLAVYDNCNSLHTNAYDEAITTPTEQSVRRALAIQLILNREFGMALNENPHQGAFVIDELTELVEEAVLSEFERLSQRGGVLGAMERMYQRSKIQDESLHYEKLKHAGDYPIIGVNTFVSAEAPADQTSIALIRSSDEDKQQQLDRLHSFHERHADRATEAVHQLKHTALAGENVFAQLMSATEVLSLGQISAALSEVGGRYRRSM